MSLIRLLPSNRKVLMVKEWSLGWIGGKGRFGVLANVGGQGELQVGRGDFQVWTLDFQRHLWGWTCMDLNTNGTRDGTERGRCERWQSLIGKHGMGSSSENHSYTSMVSLGAQVFSPKLSAVMIIDVLTCPDGAWSIQNPCSCLYLTYFYFYHPNIILYVCHDGGNVRKPCYSLMM